MKFDVWWFCYMILVYDNNKCIAINVQFSKNEEAMKISAYVSHTVKITAIFLIG